MLEKILYILSQKECKDIVISKELYNELEMDKKQFITDNFSIEKIQDLRSATFFALGKNTINRKSTCIIVDGEYLSNTYTGITEAWFQRQSIVIIALYKKFDNINCNFIRRFVPNIMTIYYGVEEYKADIENAVRSRMPCLINAIYKPTNLNNFDYEKVCDQLSNILSKDEEVFLYNPKSMTPKYNFIIKEVLKEHKYGVLSKYMGYIVGKKKKVILCATDDVLEIDFNIFNNRYIDEKIKIIFFITNNKLEINKKAKWLENNNISVKITDSINYEELQEFYNSHRPEILFIGG